jgi:hypothetical protein
LIAVSPCANASIGGENIVDAASAAPVFITCRRVNLLFIESSQFFMIDPNARRAFSRACYQRITKI